MLAATEVLIEGGLHQTFRRVRTVTDGLPSGISADAGYDFIDFRGVKRR